VFPSRIIRLPLAGGWPLLAEEQAALRLPRRAEDGLTLAKRRNYPESPAARPVLFVMTLS
jgi:hypothetical protein